MLLPCSERGKRERERCGSQFSRREEISQDAANDRTSLVARIEKYGCTRAKRAKRAKRSYRAQLDWKASDNSLNTHLASSNEATGFYATLSSTIMVLWIILRIKAEYIQGLSENHAKREDSRSLKTCGLSPRDSVKSILNMYIWSGTHTHIRTSKVNLISYEPILWIILFNVYVTRTRWVNKVNRGNKLNYETNNAFSRWNTQIKNK